MDDRPVSNVLEAKKSEWESELKKVGLDAEVFETIVAIAPARDIVPGYPQDKINVMFVQKNW